MSAIQPRSSAAPTSSEVTLLVIDFTSCLTVASKTMAPRLEIMVVERRRELAVEAGQPFNRVWPAVEPMPGVVEVITTLSPGQRGNGRGGGT
jgi:hypothetical protein